VRDLPGAPPLLAGTGKEETHLLVVATSDRGLCGGFNSSIVRGARRRIADLQNEGKTVKIICIGRKGRDMLRREHGRLIIEFIDGIAGQKRIGFATRNWSRRRSSTSTKPASSTSAPSSTTSSSRR
jgi:F-type H+-transporting ATPase subunit gamma